jgi:hypothetical protein
VTLLQDLVVGAASDAAPVATLLRQLKVIAARTGAAPLADWVRYELEGYLAGETVPAYRGPFPVNVVGDFVGIMGNGVKNLPIPPMTFPADTRKGHLFNVSFAEPVAELAQFALRPALEAAWSADTVRAYNGIVAQGKIRRVVREDMVLVSAKYGIPTSTVVGILDSVRTRVLDLALELEKVAPAAGQAEVSAETTAAARQVVVAHFHGLTGNVAIASDGISQAVTVQLPGPGDEAALLRYLGAHGVDPSRLVALREALEHDRADAGGQHPPTAGARVKTWVGHALTDLGTNAAGGVIGAAITDWPRRLLRRVARGRRHRPTWAGPPCRRHAYARRTGRARRPDRAGAAGIAGREHLARVRRRLASLVGLGHRS